MAKAMKACRESGAVLAYTDTDSIIASFPKNKPLPLWMSDVEIGAFKYELGHDSIKTFYSLGPKNYSITYADKDNSLKTDIKTRGFYWKNNAKEDKVDSSCYEEFLKALLEENEEKKLLIPQFNIKIDKKNTKLFTNLYYKSFNNNVYSKRVLYKKGKKDECLVYSLPYGFTQQMLDEAKYICKNIKLPIAKN